MKQWLVIGLESEVFWPTQETNVSFQGHTFLLRPATEEHKGFCIEFVREPDNNLGNFDMAKPINYTDDYTKVEFIDSTGKASKSVAYDSFYTKARDWGYEKEWRLFYTEGGKAEPIPSAISSIIFGLEMPQENRDTIQNILSGQGISYKKAVKAESQFKIDIINLPT